jgi:hypothetical protein
MMIPQEIVGRGTLWAGGDTHPQLLTPASTFPDALRSA